MDEPWARDNVSKRCPLLFMDVHMVSMLSKYWREWLIAGTKTFEDLAEEIETDEVREYYWPGWSGVPAPPK